VAGAIAASNPAIKDADAVNILGTVLAAPTSAPAPAAAPTPAPAPAPGRRRLTAVQSFRIEYEMSMERTADLNPKQAADEIRSSLSSSSFAESMQAAGIEVGLCKLILSMNQTHVETAWN
jgi:hypothetical protein